MAKEKKIILAEDIKQHLELIRNEVQKGIGTSNLKEIAKYKREAPAGVAELISMRDYQEVLARKPLRTISAGSFATGFNNTNTNKEDIERAQISVVALNEAIKEAEREIEKLE